MLELSAVVRHLKAPLATPCQDVCKSATDEWQDDRVTVEGLSELVDMPVATVGSWSVGGQFVSGLWPIPGPLEKELKVKGVVGANLTPE
ncbi:hypothetical protein M0804_004325 [Polistes exclamans]|nr:hypothetical protein M0804_004325 [Polistes exclamans]